MNLKTEASCASAPCATVTASHHRSLSYDTETGFYYLQSRYYDPAICRFINADAYVSSGTGFLGCNMFAYCNNNPINYVDFAGNMAVAVVGMGTTMALNWWNPIGWAVAGGLAIVGLIVLYETATVIVTEVNKLIVERKTGSTPASPQPPRNNGSNSSSNNSSSNSIRMCRKFVGHLFFQSFLR